MVRHVAGRVDVGRAGPAQLVGQDPVLLRDRAAADIGLDADARHGEIARDPLTGAGHDRFQAFGALEGGHLISGPQLDTLSAVDGADQRADLAAQDRSSGSRPGKTAVTGRRAGSARQPPHSR